MFTHILLPTDGSELSLHAIDTRIALAAKIGAKVYAFHVIPPLPAVRYFADMLQMPEATYTSSAEHRAQGYLASVRERADAAGVPCDTGYAIDRRPYCAIAGAAAKQHCDLIVMATHGWRCFDRLLLGSETHKVILNVNVPVLVVRS